MYLGSRHRQLESSALAMQAGAVGYSTITNGWKEVQGGGLFGADPGKGVWRAVCRAALCWFSNRFKLHLSVMSDFLMC